MKTLGQIAFEATFPTGRWECIGEHFQNKVWETAAKAVAAAVRAETLEACAGRCEEIAAHGEILMSPKQMARYCAAAIRSLASEKT